MNSWYGNICLEKVYLIGKCCDLMRIEEISERSEVVKGDASESGLDDSGKS